MRLIVCARSNRKNGIGGVKAVIEMRLKAGLDNSKVEASLAITIRTSSEGLKVIRLSQQEVSERKASCYLHSS